MSLCTRSFSLLVALLLGACTSSSPHRPVVASGAAVPDMTRIYRAGDIYFAGQPDVARFEQLRDLGVRTVINLRSAREMTELAEAEQDALDQITVLRDLGLHYVHIPLGGNDGYNPTHVQAFAAAIEAASGPVLVHCASGARARVMWQAYLVTYRGYTLDEAVEITRTLGDNPYPIEQLLGRRLRQRPAGRL
ncbi:MAG: tyrosine-protein phosphatase [Phycisphaeraceae bacterium]|nr:tyrosine-protein phosphatase [Phycisphaeraceae bacterium]MCW5753698.1 tyrosine-protein phosphatase [Phycisphaeraceae bacterium]